VDGVNGGNSGRNVTDEVIDSALRYRVQAPMIDNLMKEMGIEGGSLGRMTDVLRDAKDISALTRDSKSGKAKASKDDRDRDS
jgi:Flotillin